MSADFRKHLITELCEKHLRDPWSELGPEDLKVRTEAYHRQKNNLINRLCLSDERRKAVLNGDPLRYQALSVHLQYQTLSVHFGGKKFNFSSLYRSKTRWKSPKLTMVKDHDTSKWHCCLKVFDKVCLPLRIVSAFLDLVDRVNSHLSPVKNSPFLEAGLDSIEGTVRLWSDWTYKGTSFEWKMSLSQLFYELNPAGIMLTKTVDSALSAGKKTGVSDMMKVWPERIPPDDIDRIAFLMWLRENKGEGAIGTFEQLVAPYLSCGSEDPNNDGLTEHVRSIPGLLTAANIVMST